MEVKGTAIVVMPMFVKKNFQEAGLVRWLHAISAEAQAVYAKPILPSVWYNLRAHLLDPTIALCDLFYQGQSQGAYELGRFSADYALKGIYQLFVRIGSPDFILKKAAVIMSNYYKPSKLEVLDMEKKKAILRISEFSEMHVMIEQRIAGWICRALEISGVKNVQVAITASLLKKQLFTELTGTWD